MDEYIQLGTIIKTSGLKGEVKVYSTSYFSDIRYKKNNKVLLEFFDENNKIYYKEYIINSYRKYKNFDYLIFKDINTIEKAQTLLKKNILIKKIDAKLEKGFYFFSDLIDCTLINFDTKETIGIIKDIKEYSTISLYIQKNDNKKFYTIPFINEFIKNVDISNKIIEVKCIKGLFE